MHFTMFYSSIKNAISSVGNLKCVDYIQRTFYSYALKLMFRIGISFSTAEYRNRLTQMLLSKKALIAAICSCYLYVVLISSFQRLLDGVREGNASEVQGALNFGAYVNLLCDVSCDSSFLSVINWQ